MFYKLQILIFIKLIILSISTDTVEVYDQQYLKKAKTLFIESQDKEIKFEQLSKNQIIEDYGVAVDKNNEKLYFYQIDFNTYQVNNYKYLDILGSDPYDAYQIKSYKILKDKEVDNQILLFVLEEYDFEYKYTYQVRLVKFNISQQDGENSVNQDYFNKIIYGEDKDIQEKFYIQIEATYIQDVIYFGLLQEESGILEYFYYDPKVDDSKPQKIDTELTSGDDFYLLNYFVFAFDGGYMILRTKQNKFLFIYERQQMADGKYAFVERNFAQIGFNSKSNYVAFTNFYEDLQCFYFAIENQSNQIEIYQYEKEANTIIQISKSESILSAQFKMGYFYQNQDNIFVSITENNQIQLWDIKNLDDNNTFNYFYKMDYFRDNMIYSMQKQQVLEDQKQKIITISENLRFDYWEYKQKECDGELGFTYKLYFKELHSLEFQFPQILLAIKNQSDDVIIDNETSELCNFVLQEELIQKIGENPICDLDYDGELLSTIFTVKFGNNPTITFKEIKGLQQNEIKDDVFQMQECQKFGKNYTNQIIRLQQDGELIDEIDREKNKPLAEFIYQKQYIKCEKVIIQIKPKNNFGNHNIQIGKECSDNDQPSIICEIDKEINQIEIKNVDKDSEYNIKVTYKNFIGQQEEEVIEFQVLNDVNTNLELVNVDKSIDVLRWQSQKVIFNIEKRVCTNTGIQKEYNDINYKVLQIQKIKKEDDGECKNKDYYEEKDIEYASGNIIEIQQCFIYSNDIYILEDILKTNTTLADQSVEGIISYLFEEYKFKQGTEQLFLFTAQDNDHSKSQSYSFKFFKMNIGQSDISANFMNSEGDIIQGGQHSYKEPLQFLIDYRDKDIQDLEYQQKNFTITWSCITLQTNDNCLNNNDQIILKEISERYRGHDGEQSDKQFDKLEYSDGEFDTLQFQKQYFRPYQSYIFKVNVTKSEDNNENGDGEENTIEQNEQNDRKLTVIKQIIFVVVQTDLPQIKAIFPKALSKEQENYKPINIKDEIKIEVNYKEKSPEEMMYSIILVYDNLKVAIDSFKHNTFTFRVEDIFLGFKGNDYDLTLIVNAYDPDFVMPYQSDVQFIVNQPPNVKELYVDKKNGISIDTVFKFEVRDYQDFICDFKNPEEDCKETTDGLQFKFVYYFSKNDILKETYQGTNVVSYYQNQLTDFQDSHKLETILPMPYQITIDELEEDGEQQQSEQQEQQEGQLQEQDGELQQNQTRNLEETASTQSDGENQENEKEEDEDEETEFLEEEEEKQLILFDESLFKYSLHVMVIVKDKDGGIANKTQEIWLNYDEVNKKPMNITAEQIFEKVEKRLNTTRVLPNDDTEQMWKKIRYYEVITQEMSQNKNLLIKTDFRAYQNIIESMGEDQQNMLLFVKQSQKQQLMKTVNVLKGLQYEIIKIQQQKEKEKNLNSTTIISLSQDQVLNNYLNLKEELVYQTKLLYEMDFQNVVDEFDAEKLLKIQNSMETLNQILNGLSGLSDSIATSQKSLITLKGKDAKSIQEIVDGEIDWDLLNDGELTEQRILQVQNQEKKILQEEIMKNIEFIGQLKMQSLVPNGNPIIYEQNGLLSKIQVKTSQDAQKLFKNVLENLQDETDEQDGELVFDGENQLIQNTFSSFDKEGDNDKLYDIQYIKQDNNLLASDSSYHYKNQTNQVAEYKINPKSKTTSKNAKLSIGTPVSEVSINDDYSLSFDIKNPFSNGDSLFQFDSSNENTMCIQENEKKNGYSGDNCNLSIQLNNDFNCECSGLGKVTIVNDYDFIFSKGPDIAAALFRNQDLSGFLFYNSIVFYMLFVVVVVEIYLIKDGYFHDKDDRIIKNTVHPLEKLQQEVSDLQDIDFKEVHQKEEKEVQKNQDLVDLNQKETTMKSTQDQFLTQEDKNKNKFNFNLKNGKRRRNNQKNNNNVSQNENDSHNNLSRSVSKKDITSENHSQNNLLENVSQLSMNDLKDHTGVQHFDNISGIDKNESYVRNRNFSDTSYIQNNDDLNEEGNGQGSGGGAGGGDVPDDNQIIVEDFNQDEIIIDDLEIQDNDIIVDDQLEQQEEQIIQNDDDDNNNIDDLDDIISISSQNKDSSSQQQENNSQLQQSNSEAQNNEIDNFSNNCESLNNGSESQNNDSETQNNDSESDSSSSSSDSDSDNEDDDQESNTESNEDKVSQASSSIQNKTDSQSIDNNIEVINCDDINNNNNDQQNKKLKCNNFTSGEVIKLDDKQEKDKDTHEIQVEDYSDLEDNDEKIQQKKQMQDTTQQQQQQQCEVRNQQFSNNSIKNNEINVINEDPDDILISVSSDTKRKKSINSSNSIEIINDSNDEQDNENSDKQEDFYEQKQQQDNNLQIIHCSQKSISENLDQQNQINNLEVSIDQKSDVYSSGDKLGTTITNTTGNQSINQLDNQAIEIPNNSQQFQKQSQSKQKFLQNFTTSLKQSHKSRNKNRNQQKMDKIFNKKSENTDNTDKGQLALTMKAQQSSIQKKEDDKIKLSCYITFIMFHEFYGISIVAQENISRPIRYILICLKYQITMFFVSLLSSGDSLIQMIMASVICFFLVSLPISLIALITRQKFKCMKIFGVVVALILKGLSFYQIMVQAAILGPAISNYWVFTYVISFLVDFCGLQTFISLFKNFVISRFRDIPKHKFLKIMFKKEEIKEYFKLEGNLTKNLRYFNRIVNNQE